MDEVIKREQPDSTLLSMGGQTAINCGEGRGGARVGGGGGSGTVQGGYGEGTGRIRGEKRAGRGEVTGRIPSVYIIQG